MKERFDLIFGNNISNEIASEISEIYLLDGYKYHDLKTLLNENLSSKFSHLPNDTLAKLKMVLYLRLREMNPCPTAMPIRNQQYTWNILQNYCINLSQAAKNTIQIETDGFFNHPLILQDFALILTIAEKEKMDISNKLTSLPQIAVWHLMYCTYLVSNEKNLPKEITAIPSTNTFAELATWFIKCCELCNNKNILTLLTKMIIVCTTANDEIKRMRRALFKPLLTNVRINLNNISEFQGYCDLLFSLHDNQDALLENMISCLNELRNPELLTLLLLNYCAKYHAFSTSIPALLSIAKKSTDFLERVATVVLDKACDPKQPYMFTGNLILGQINDSIKVPTQAKLNQYLMDSIDNLKNFPSQSPWEVNQFNAFLRTMIALGANPFHFANNTCALVESIKQTEFFKEAKCDLLPTLLSTKGNFDTLSLHFDLIELQKHCPNLAMLCSEHGYRHNIISQLIDLGFEIDVSLAYKLLKNCQVGNTEKEDISDQIIIKAMIKILEELKQRFTTKNAQPYTSQNLEQDLELVIQNVSDFFTTQEIVNWYISFASIYNPSAKQIADHLMSHLMREKANNELQKDYENRLTCVVILNEAFSNNDINWIYHMKLMGQAGNKSDYQTYIEANPTQLFELMLRTYRMALAYNLTSKIQYPFIFNLIIYYALSRLVSVPSDKIQHEMAKVIEDIPDQVLTRHYIMLDSNCLAIILNDFAKIVAMRLRPLLEACVMVRGRRLSKEFSRIDTFVPLLLACTKSTFTSQRMIDTVLGIDNSANNSHKDVYQTNLTFSSEKLALDNQLKNLIDSVHRESGIFLNSDSKRLCNITASALLNKLNNLSGFDLFCAIILLGYFNELIGPIQFVEVPCKTVLNKILRDAFVAVQSVVKEPFFETYYAGIDKHRTWIVGCFNTWLAMMIALNADPFELENNSCALMASFQETHFFSRNVCELLPVILSSKLPFNLKNLYACNQDPLGLALEHGYPQGIIQQLLNLGCDVKRCEIPINSSFRNDTLFTLFSHTQKLLRQQSAEQSSLPAENNISQLATSLK